MTVISTPSFLRAHPSSRPIYPPPITAIFSGNSSKSSAPVEEMMFSSSYGINGNSIGLDPVAKITFSVVMWAILFPSESVTLQVLPSRNVAQPLTSLAPLALRSASTPLLSLSTILSFQSTNAGISIETSPSTLRPMCPL